jgi:hypothetical protein
MSAISRAFHFVTEQLGKLWKHFRERCNGCFILVFIIACVMFGIFSKNSIKSYPVDCFTSAAFPYENQNVLVASPYVQCKLLIGKYSATPEPVALTYINGTFEGSHMFSYDAALLSSFYDNDDVEVLDVDAIKTGVPFDLPILSYAGTRIYYLVLTRSTSEPVEFRFLLPGAQMPNTMELLEARKAAQIFIPIGIIFLILSIFLCCHFRSCFRFGNQRGRNSRIRTRTTRNNSSDEDAYQVDLPPSYDNFAQYPEAKLESIPPQYRADVDLPGYEGISNEAFQPPKYEATSVGQQN